MAKFYNPYHFVPVEKPGPAAEWHSRKRAQLEGALANREGAGWPDQVTHERYVKETHSGRLIVRVTTVTPTVIGGEQRNQRVHPFRAGGRAAIPASTLRGLIGSIIEASSNGPLRVLQERFYSFRRQMADSLSAIGLIVGEPGKLRLQPMCLPTLESKDGGRTFPVDARFRKIFPNAPQFKVLFGDFDMIREDQFGYTTSTDRSHAVPMPVKQLVWNGSAVTDDGSLHVKSNRFAISQKPDIDDAPRLGMIRVLGCQGKVRKAAMPTTKKHELWIPLPDPKGPTLEIEAEALARFAELANERTDADATLPFEPKGTRERGKEKYLEPRAGDMVYFDVNDRGVVTEISYSAIWRRRVDDPLSRKAATAWAFFEKEQRPFYRRPAAGTEPEEKRETISLSEQLLGFAEEFVSGKEPAHEAAPNPQGGLALASRLLFADGLLAEGTGEFEAPVLLRILDSPKLPCPSLYFKAKDGRGAYFLKRDLSPAKCAPQGRKWYLHAKTQPGQEPWRTRKPNDGLTQKSIVEPLKAGQSFFFHIDFDNLSNEELGLLLYAIEPDARFHHKIGMGKPLGLGTVKLEIMGLFPIDRPKRYSLEGLRSGRYGGAEWTEVGRAAKAGIAWPSRYEAEKSAPEAPTGTMAKAREQLTESKLIPPDIHAALTLLGNYAAAPLATTVHYPTVAGQPDPEADHYKWFVFNDGLKERGRGMTPAGQYLKPLTRQTKALPDLEEMS
jgi:CRISPR-associated protein (TIGR03986 family)